MTHSENLTAFDKKIEIYSVSRLNREIRMIVEGKFPFVWVEGEISNCKYHSSGHIYLTLKDDKSQVPAVLFSRFNSGLKFELKDGLQVTAGCRVSLYEARGQYQLYIERIEPKGLGALQLAFLQLKEKLEAEGLFDPAHKKMIPKFPVRVGVVTSPTGAAIRDILNVIGRRFGGTHVLLAPVRVQGDGAAKEIAAAIEEMNRQPDVDVLIVGRGGGSLEDLWAFNEERVARAVYASRIPVISAVGHEIDWTICDFVADLRAPTPSAAAELVVQSREEYLARIQELQRCLFRCANYYMDRWKENLRELQESYAFKQPRMLIQQFSQRQDELIRQCQNYLKAVVVQKRQEFRTLAGRLSALSPLAILTRGYSISLDEEGRLIREIRSLKKGNTVKTRLTDGWFHSTITKIEPAKGDALNA